jgi:hypothetical protein
VLQAGASPYNKGTKRTLPSNRFQTAMSPKRGNHTPLPARGFKAVETAGSFSTTGLKPRSFPTYRVFFMIDLVLAGLQWKTKSH